MDKKSEGHNSGKGSERGGGHDKRDKERGFGEKGQRENIGADREYRGQESSASEFREKAAENLKQGAEASDYRQAAEARREQNQEESDYHFRVEADKLAEETKKGCLPKLAMLLLPMVALGTYVFLNS